MNNETKAWIVIILTGVIFLTDDFFSFLSKGWTNLLLVIMGIGWMYLLAKNAAREVLKEHDFDK